MLAVYNYPPDRLFRYLTADVLAAIRVPAWPFQLPVHHGGICEEISLPGNWSYRPLWDQPAISTNPRRSHFFIYWSSSSSERSRNSYVFFLLIKSRHEEIGSMGCVQCVSTCAGAHICPGASRRQSAAGCHHLIWLIHLICMILCIFS